ncbi:hypothetical protein C8J57DRAFT_1710630 [Mycena rebaudengoi]|nr:hypothetical protein C8J57DRAFT_1710630 [Mycena rebaudengoi]
MSTPNETDPLLGRTSTTVHASERQATFTWLIPVVAVSSICRGISMFSRFAYYQDTFCRDVYGTCGWFILWIELPSVTVRMQMWTMFASFVVSFMSIGWWSARGDQKGRKHVLFFSLLGGLLLDLIYLIVLNVPSLHADARDSLSLALIIDGLLGGFATFNAVIHAYTFDVSPTPLSRTLLFGVLEALLLTGFLLGATIGRSVRLDMSYLISIILGALNLAYIHFALPESLKPNQAANAPPSHRSALKSIVSPFSVFLRNAESRKYLPLFAIAFYVYGLTSAMDTAMLRYTAISPFLPSLPRSILLSAPRIINLVALLGILPAIAIMFRKSYGDNEGSGMRLSTSVAQNFALIATLSSLGVLVFCYDSSSQFLYGLFVFVYPFTTVVTPALYSMGASYFLALDRGAEIGSLFGALSIWASLAQFVSYTLYEGTSVAAFFLSAFFLVLAIVLLVPDPPVAQDSGSDVPPSQV